MGKEGQRRLLIVNRDLEELCYDTENGGRFKKKVLGLGLPDKVGQLFFDSRYNLSRTGKLTLVMEHNDRRTPINLPPKITTRLSEFLRTGQKRYESFDCGSFVHYLHGIDYRFGCFEVRKWKFAYVLPTFLKVGDTMLFSASKDWREQSAFKHMAIYLGHGICLSKYGPRGNMIANEIDQLKLGYGADNIFLMTPITR